MIATTFMARSSKAVRWPVRAILVGLFTGGTVFLMFLILAIVSLTQTDRPRFSAAVVRAFSTGALSPQRSWEFQNTRIGAHQFNDCLILYQSLDDRAPVLQRAISPLSVPLDSDFPCAQLADLATVGKAGPPRFYHQYLHAHTTVARLLVPAAGVSGLRELYRLSITLVLLAGAGFAMIALAQNQKRRLATIWLIAFVVFARWFGLESFGQSLSHGASDLILIGFLFCLSRASISAPLSSKGATLAAALFGACTMQFEFLTGGLPLGLASVIGAMPLAYAPGVAVVRTTAHAAVAFSTAAFATVLAKVIVGITLFGFAPFADLPRQALFRAGIAENSLRDQPVDWGDFLLTLWAGLGGLASGMHWLIFGTLTLAATAGFWGYGKVRKAEAAGDKLLAICLALSSLVPLAWLLIFKQHTTQHAWFMDRILVWTIVAGLALFALAITGEERDPIRPD